MRQQQNRILGGMMTRKAQVSYALLAIAILATGVIAGFVRIADDPDHYMGILGLIGLPLLVLHPVGIAILAAAFLAMHYKKFAVARGIILLGFVALAYGAYLLITEPVSE